MFEINKIYIGGKITGDSNYKAKFEEAERRLTEQGYTVLNPAILPEGFEYEDYMLICFAMIDACQCAYFLKDSEYSAGAQREIAHCKSMHYPIIFEDDEDENDA